MFMKKTGNSRLIQTMPEMRFFVVSTGGETLSAAACTHLRLPLREATGPQVKPRPGPELGEETESPHPGWLSARKPSQSFFQGKEALPVGVTISEERHTRSPAED